jgi:hypothetical protein
MAPLWSRSRRTRSFFSGIVTDLSGVSEPFECRFVLDVVERSLRDVLAVVPIKYYDQALDSYQSYQFRDADDENRIKMRNFSEALSKFRNPQWDDVS